MSLFSSGKMLLQKYPGLLPWAVRLYNGLLGWNRRKISGCGNQTSGMSFRHHTTVAINGNHNVIDWGNSCFWDHCHIYIAGDHNKIVLGKRCVLHQLDLWLEDDGNTIIIGDHTHVTGFTHLAATEGKKIVIGEDCLFASNVVVRTGDSHSILDADRGNRINPAQDTLIGNHVWLGAQTTLLKGASVADHSVVGTGAIVTGKYEQSHVVLAGNPARIVKEKVDWLPQRIPPSEPQN